MDASLAQLHELSSLYSPNNNSRDSWRDKIDFINDILSDFPEEKSAKAELNEINNWLSTLRVNNNNYGLIHYDFEQDNVLLVKETGEFNIIDFDDSMYHWYIMDIVCVLEEIKGQKNSKVKSDHFMKGYLSIRKIEDNLINQKENFSRFKNLYTYARLLRSLKDSNFENKPEWVDFVRNKLNSRCDELREVFDRK